MKGEIELEREKSVMEGGGFQNRRREAKVQTPPPFALDSLVGLAKDPMQAITIKSLSFFSSD